MSIMATYSSSDSRYRAWPVLSKQCLSCRICDKKRGLPFELDGRYVHVLKIKMFAAGWVMYPRTSGPRVLGYTTQPTANILIFIIAHGLQQLYKILGVPAPKTQQGQGIGITARINTQDESIGTPLFKSNRNIFCNVKKWYLSSKYRFVILRVVLWRVLVWAGKISWYFVRVWYL